MDFLDRVLTCNDCGREFVFTAGEQLFFFDKQFKNDPKRCKPCKGKRQAAVTARLGAGVGTMTPFRTETRTECSSCKIETTVPFRPTQGRPVLCRQCFQKRQSRVKITPVAAAGRAEAVGQMKYATAELIAAASATDHLTPAKTELMSIRPVRP